MSVENRAYPDGLQTFINPSISVPVTNIGDPETVDRLRREWSRLHEGSPPTFRLSSSQYLENLTMSNLAISAHGQHSTFEVKLYLSQCSLAERGLVEAILKTPVDAALRDVYADYLLENGRELEAESERKFAEQIRKPTEDPRVHSGWVNPNQFIIGPLMSGEVRQGRPTGSW